jgi:hypothetical protein
MTSVALLKPSFDLKHDPASVRNLAMIPVHQRPCERPRAATD